MYYLKGGRTTCCYTFRAQYAIGTHSTFLTSPGAMVRVPSAFSRHPALFSIYSLLLSPLPSQLSSVIISVVFRCVQSDVRLINSDMYQTMPRAHGIRLTQKGEQLGPLLGGREQVLG